ncbi:MAG: hypothetical protein H6742_03350 [Alphaproteobacteria bacterium]|nr:hypothetical protein [Alphaproteobacteria bacterium]
MRVCLQCNSEYVDDPEHCRECGAETVTAEEADFQRELRDRLATEELIVVKELDGPVDEAILARVFEDNGVVFTIRGGDRGGHLPGITHGAGSWGQLLVPEDQVEAAQRLIKAYDESVIVEDED